MSPHKCGLAALSICMYGSLSWLTDTHLKILAWCAVMLAFGLKARALSRATWNHRERMIANIIARMNKTTYYSALFLSSPAISHLSVFSLSTNTCRNSTSFIESQNLTKQIFNICHQHRPMWSAFRNFWSQKEHLHLNIGYQNNKVTDDRFRLLRIIRLQHGQLAISYGVRPSSHMKMLFLYNETMRMNDLNASWISRFLRPGDDCKRKKVILTSAFGFPTWRLWNRNWRFRLETSIVSKSIFRQKKRKESEKRKIWQRSTSVKLSKTIMQWS